MSLTVIPTTDFDACLALRRAVFIEEQGVDEALEVDGLDAGATHLLALEDGVPVGTARLVAKGELLKVGRVCVLASHRGRGIGAEIMRAALEAARDMPGITAVTLGAQTHALAFYERLGFAAHGPEFDDAGIPHRQMTLNL